MLFGKGSGCWVGNCLEDRRCWVEIIDVEECKKSVSMFDGPLARYVKLRVAHAPGMPGTFSLPPRVSDPDMHHGNVRDIRAVMHFGIAN